MYNSDFTLASETNSLGVTTTYTYDSVTGTKSIEEFDIYTYYYLPHGEVSRVEADGELVVRYEYNSKYEVTLEAHSEPPQQSGGGDYSGEGSEPPRNQDIIYTYNSAGQLVSQTRASELTPYLTYTYTDGELSEKLNLDSGLRYVYTDDTIFVYKDSTNELLYYYENTSEENSNVSSSSETHFGTSVSGESGEDYSWQQIGDNNSHYSFTENSAGYITAEQIKYNDATVLSASCIYDNSGNITSKSYSGIATYQNTFDSEGRITSSSKSATGNSVNQYFFDAQDQLVRVNSAERGYTCAYTYDTRGNITSKKYYSYTTAESLEGLTPTHQDTFAYSTTREDQLVSYNNNYYTYDDRGYLTSDGTHYFDWANGRQLVSVGSDIAYTYDENGIRTTKEVDGTTTYFNTSDGVILSQSDDENTLIFQYDNGGLPVGFTWNGTQYYYLTNSSGDVLGICNTSGEVLVEYTYDEWGKLIDIGISANADEDLAEINPLRYRGYYYDIETGFYYLQSRYYNPEISRFINADTYTNTGTGTILQYNMFAYCENDPVNYDDPTGEYYYNREEAVRYAHRYCYVPNPKYYFYSQDCTNFVSQCLFAGGFKKSNLWHSYSSYNVGLECPTKKDKITYKYFRYWDISDAWRLAKKNYNYFSQSYIAIKILILTISNYNKINKNAVRTGDILYFDEGDTKGIHHAAIVTKVDKKGIYYTAHTNPEYDKNISKYFKNKKQKLYLIMIGGGR